MVNLLKYRRRLFHTIISREIIKPSSPTPSHLQRYNLSPIDKLAPNVNMPMILFYQNCSSPALDTATMMKKSLSQSLTQYYPFAGRIHTPTIPYVDCNDEGVAFVEAKNDARMDTFQNNSAQFETLVQLLPDGNNSNNLVSVQLNYFACGGVALGVSMSHLVGDACTLGSFVNYWASVTRYGSLNHKEVLPLNPSFIHTPWTDSFQPEYMAINPPYHGNYIMRKFTFPNSKLSDLKNKVIAKTESESKPVKKNMPTRFEVLTSLLYKTAVAAATEKSGCFKPSFLYISVDARKNMVERLPQTTVGNLVSLYIVPTRHKSDTELSTLVDKIQKEKVTLKREEFQSVEQVAEYKKSLMSKLEHEEFSKRVYYCSSTLGFLFDKVDFGRGKPAGTTLPFHADLNAMVLMDAPNGEGIEASVYLEKGEMEIFENDKEMLSFCEINHK